MAGVPRTAAGREAFAHPPMTSIEVMALVYAIEDELRAAALAAEPADTTGSDWATAAAEVHRAFCDPEHELVGEWDREMAESLRRNGLRIVPAEPADAPGLREPNPEYDPMQGGSGARQSDLRKARAALTATEDK